MSIFDVIRLRNWDTLRAWLYVLAPTLILAFGVDHATHWIAVVGAVLAPALSAANSVEGFRRWFYGALVPVQALLLTLGVATDAALASVTSVIVAIVGGGLAAANVHAGK